MNAGVREHPRPALIALYRQLRARNPDVGSAGRRSLGRGDTTLRYTRYTAVPV
jgi:hypothetical protein